jgi:hypothetical protein
MVEGGVLAAKSGPTGGTLYNLPVPGGYFATGMGRAGDLNADGFEDVLLGLAPLVNAPNAYAAISTIPTGVAAFGAGCPQPSGEIPRIGAKGPATQGQSLVINMSRVPPGRQGALILGLSNTLWGATPLPWSLGSLGLPTCALLSSVEEFIGVQTQQVSPGWGAASASVAIPSAPGLQGLTFYAQYAITNAPGSTYSVGLSRGLAITIQ